MSSTTDSPSHLEPFPVILSVLHLSSEISALHTLAGIEVSLPGTGTSAPIRFKAIVSESTNRNLLLKSFYEANVRGKAFNGTKYVLSPLATHGISRCAFTSTLGMMHGQPRLNDQTAPQFNVDGLSRVPFMHQGYFFKPTFLICDHIFYRQEFEAQFVAVLSSDFLREYFIRAQSSEQGYRIQLPPPPPAQTSDLLIYTDGCCLSNGKAAEDNGAKPAQGGYGIHFPTLPEGWDMYGALAADHTHTHQKAELTAVIRALQLVRLRKIPCARISIFTDSKYAVQGLNERIPLWRSKGYRTSKKHGVVNANLFRCLDNEVSISTKRGIPVTLSHVPRKQNQKADALSKLGAASSTPEFKSCEPDKGSTEEAEAKTMGCPDKGSKKGAEVKAKGCGREEGRPVGILGRQLIEILMPLVQWTPDGSYWAEWQHDRLEYL